MNINTSGNNTQISTGENSTNNQTINCTAKNAGWFITGILLPTIAGLLVEIFKDGGISSILSQAIKLIK